MTIDPRCVRKMTPAVADGGEEKTVSRRKAVGAEAIDRNRNWSGKKEAGGATPGFLGLTMGGYLTHIWGATPRINDRPDPRLDQPHVYHDCHGAGEFKFCGFLRGRVRPGSLRCSRA